MVITPVNNARVNAVSSWIHFISDPVAQSIHQCNAHWKNKVEETKRYSIESDFQTDHHSFKYDFSTFPRKKCSNQTFLVRNFCKLQTLVYSNVGDFAMLKQYKLTSRWSLQHSSPTSVTNIDTVVSDTVSDLMTVSGFFKLTIHYMWMDIQNV